jgi:hypothetical protein
MVKLHADKLCNGYWMVRPATRFGAQLGTCGFYPYAWTAIIVRAKGFHDATRKATPRAVAQILGGN